MTAREPKFFYFVIDRATGQYVLPGPKVTRHAGESQARFARQRGKDVVVAQIPSADVLAWHAAYLRQHGTRRDGRPA